MGDGQDDLLSPEEVEALMQAARGDAGPPAGPPGGEQLEALMKASKPAPPPTPPAPPMGGAAPASGNDLLSAHEIDALLAMQPPAGRARSAPTPSSGTSAAAEQSLRQVEKQLQAAMAPESGRSRAMLPPGLGAPELYAFEDFDGTRSAPTAPAAFGLDALQDVELDLRIELGRAELLIEDVLQLREGSVVPLDKLAGDPVDILVNGRLLARGEVLVLNDNFCVRVAEILQPD